MKECPKCKEAHSKSGVFCSRKCANSRGPRSEDFKKKVSLKLKGRKNSTPRKPLYEYYKIKRISCSFCQKNFWSYLPKNSKRCYRTTCSDDCYIEIKRKNALGIKRQYYKDIAFDNNWEVRMAKLLDEKNYKWIYSPAPIFWLDKKGKKRRYFPDFYLPEYNIYLDPKNPICIEKQKEKLDIVTISITLIYGNPEEIMARLIGLEPT